MIEEIQFWGYWYFYIKLPQNSTLHFLHSSPGGSLTYIHVLSSSSKALEIQPLTRISLMWNYDTLSQIFIPKGNPFLCPTKITHPFYTPLTHIMTKNEPKMQIFTLFCPFFWFGDPYRGPRVGAASVKTIPFPSFFCLRMATCLARVVPPPPGHSSLLGFK